jgi:S1-C subfamily serine protease
MDAGTMRETLQDCGEDGREALASQIAKEATPTELVEVAKLLLDPEPGVRLGAIEVLGAARFKASLGTLRAVARKREGEERARAVAALARMAGAADAAALLEDAKGFAADADEAVASAGRSLLTAIGDGEAKSGSTSVFGLLSPDRDMRRKALVGVIKDHPDPAAALVDSLKDAKSDAACMDLVSGLGMLGADVISDALPGLLDETDNDSLVALCARMATEKLKEAPRIARRRVAEAFLRAQPRLTSPLSQSATQAAALALAPDIAALKQVARIAVLEPEDLEGLANALAELPDDVRGDALDQLVDALGDKPTRIAWFGDVLAAHLEQVGFAKRATLGALAMKAAASHEDDDGYERYLGALARLLAKLAMPGAPLPRQLVVGLELSPDVRDVISLAELCRALGTEEAAHALARLLRHKDEAVRALAREILERFPEDEVFVRFDGEDAKLEPNRKTPDGVPLSASGRFLVDDRKRRWLLGADNTPILEEESPHGGCRCCFRPRLLEPPVPGEKRPALPTCPITGSRHFIDDAEGPILEEGHALGGCAVCDSVAPLKREGDDVICSACHTTYQRKGDKYVRFQKRPKDPSYLEGDIMVLEESEYIPKVNENELVPPSESDLEDMPEGVQRAMKANVVLYGRGSFNDWGASGIVVAKRGAEVAILTGRHSLEVSEGFEKGERIPLTCVTMAGEHAGTRVLWAAGKGLDLALLVARLKEPDAVEVTDLLEGRAAKLNDSIFAVGNALGFAWSYSADVATGIRTMQTKQGLDVRYLQTPMDVAPGMGGGGYYHEDGALCGTISWVRVSTSSRTRFGISVDSVVEALRREDVRFGGEALIAGDSDEN